MVSIFGGISKVIIGVNRCSNFTNISKTLCVSHSLHVDDSIQSKHIETQHENSKPSKFSYGNVTQKESKNINFGNPDEFGTFTLQKHVAEFMEGDKDDIREEEYVKNIPGIRSNIRTSQYAKIIKEYLKEKKIKEAIDVLETKMLKVDRAIPVPYIYNLLIGACGDFGFAKKAFQLYNQMKKRGLKLDGSTYTGLLNACANCPSREEGLKKLIHFREQMIEKGVEFNGTNYNAMIKAYGRCGEITTAFALVDEMKDKQLPIQESTFNFLLQACITDKEAGFRHALLVWRKLRLKKLRPTVYSYNLLLRSVRECGLGDLDSSESVIKKITGRSDITSETSTQLSAGQIDSISESTESSNETSAISPVEEEESILLADSAWPNLIARKPVLGNLLSVSEIGKPHERLLLVGGFTGFLNQMVVDKVQPNMKTFTLLLDIIPSSLTAEKILLKKVKASDTKPDVDFFNMLIKRRCLRFDYTSARDVLLMIQEEKLFPDIITFGVLSLTCNTLEKADQLFEDMENAGYRLNIEILDSMLTCACSQKNFQYVKRLMYICKKENIRPNETFLKKLDQLLSEATLIVENKDNLPSGIKLPYGFETERFESEFTKFSKFYKKWLSHIFPYFKEKQHASNHSSRLQ